MVAPLEEAEPPPLVRQVLDVLRQLVHEAVDLVDERRDEERADADDDRDHDQEREPGGEAAVVDAVPLEELDRRVQRKREEERDDDPREHLARDPHDLEHDGDRDRDPEHGEHGRDPESDQALLHVAASIAARSDV